MVSMKPVYHPAVRNQMNFGADAILQIPLGLYAIESIARGPIRQRASPSEARCFYNRNAWTSTHYLLQQPLGLLLQSQYIRPDLVQRSHGASACRSTV